MLSNKIIIFGNKIQAFGAFFVVKEDVFQIDWFLRFDRLKIFLLFGDFKQLNRHGRIQTCLCVTASACAPTHADRRRQDILATHGYENTEWFFQDGFVFFHGKPVRKGRFKDEGNH